ncbi:MAG: hypothetical protein IKD31_06565 [Clostridia bacterium]|nr:hypothetical protein [Clostridia bacterium]
MTFSETVVSKVPDPSLKEQLAAIPLAKKGTAPDLLRKICLDYMKLQISFQWKPSQDYNYTVVSQKYPVSLKKDTLHGGIPYVTIGTGNLYRVAEYYDAETGTVDVGELGEEMEIFGNACSGAASSAWARCITSAKLGFTFDMTQYNGYINVGPYTYPKDLKQFITKDFHHGHKRYSPDEICLENGAEIMFESYAKALPADGLVNHGHVRMVSSAPTVFRNADGTINGKNSFLLYCDQVCYENAPHHLKAADGEDAPLYKVHGGLDVKISFAELFETGYIPVTFKEFLGEADVKKPYFNMNHYKTTFSVEELKELELICNYPMSDFFITVSDPNGKVLYRRTTRLKASSPEEWDLYRVALPRILPLDELKPFEEACNNHLNIDAQTLKGSVVKAMDGILMPGTVAKKVFEPLTPERLAAIPLATPDMTPDELRKIVLDFMHLQLSFQYMPSEDYHYPAISIHHCLLKGGCVTAGLPYITIGSGSLYRIMDYMDPKTGILDVSEFKKLHQCYLGNACSGGAGISWSRCISSANLTWCGSMTKKNGYLPIAPCDYNFDGANFIKDPKSPRHFIPRTVCAQNGEQTMFESYANAKLADGLVSGSGGHIRLVSGVATVVRRDDGSIDGDKSFLLYSDQAHYTGSWERHHAQKTPDGNHYTVQGGVRVKESFATLFSKGYIPVTFKEFLGEAKVSLPKIETNIALEKISLPLLSQVRFVSNYGVSDIFTTVIDENGTELYRGIYRSQLFTEKRFKGKDFLESEKIAPFAKSGKNRIRIQFRLYYGTTETAYDALLTE